jgi:hypothetical protein
MKAQLQETVIDWGIEIDTIEFTEVWVRSKELFESLQADYRNRMRLQAAQSNAETERQIAEKKIETNQEVAALKARSDRLTRVTTSEEQRLARTTEIADQAKVHELTQSEEAAARRREIETQREIEEREKEKEYHLRRKQLELVQAEELARLEAQMAEQQESHQVDLDRRAKATEVRVNEVETARRLAELKKQAEIQEVELERQRGEAQARVELERQQAEAERRRLEAETRAGEIERMALAEKAKALELAEAVKARRTWSSRGTCRSSSSRSSPRWPRRCGSRTCAGSTWRAAAAAAAKTRWGSSPGRLPTCWVCSKEWVWTSGECSGGRTTTPAATRPWRTRRRGRARSGRPPRPEAPPDPGYEPSRKGAPAGCAEQPAGFFATTR